MTLEIPELIKLINEKVGSEAAKQVEEIIQEREMWYKEAKTLRLHLMYK